MRKTLLAIALMACWVPALGETQGWQNCTFKHAVTEVQSLKDVPATLVQQLPHPIADKGRAFNAGDVFITGVNDTLPTFGVLRAGHSGSRWFVWVESGGVAVLKKVYMMETGAGLAGDNTPQSQISEPQKYISDLCARTDIMLDAPQ